MSIMAKKTTKANEEVTTAAAQKAETAATAVKEDVKEEGKAIAKDAVGDKEEVKAEVKEAVKKEAKTEAKAEEKKVKEEVAQAVAEALNTDEEPIYATINDADLKQIVALLNEIKESNQKQMKYLKRQSGWALFSSLLALFVVLVIAIIGMLLDGVLRLVEKRLFKWKVA